MQWGMRGGLLAVVMGLSIGGANTASAQSVTEVIDGGTRLLEKLTVANLTKPCLTDTERAAFESDVGRWMRSANAFASDNNIKSQTPTIDQLRKSLAAKPKCNPPVQTATAAPRTAVQYNSPSSAGLWGPSFVANGEDNFWDTALRYAGEFGGFRIAAGAGVRDTSATFTTNTLGSINILNPVDFLANIAKVSDETLVGRVAVGYDVPIGNFIVGGEFSVGFGNNSQTISGIPGIGAFVPNAVGRGDSIVIEQNNDFTLTGRLGFVVAPKLMVYGTGGYTWVNTKTTFNCDTLGFCGAAPAEAPFSFAQRKTLSGPVYGAGFEWAVGPGFAVQGQWTHRELGDLNVALGDMATRYVGGTQTGMSSDEYMISLVIRAIPFPAPPPPP